VFSLFALCFFSRVLFLHRTVHHRAAYFLLFTTAGAALYPLSIFFFPPIAHHPSYVFLSLVAPPLSSFSRSWLHHSPHACAPSPPLTLFSSINTRRPIIGINTHPPIIGRHFLFSLSRHSLPRHYLTCHSLPRHFLHRQSLTRHSLSCHSLSRHSLSYHCLYVLLFSRICHFYLLC
jgi:hypothetical protein